VTASREMTVAERPIDSREYKIMLKASRFEGDNEALLESAARFWENLGAKLEEADGAVATDKKLDECDNPEGRPVEFYDTPECLLDSDDFVLRVRGEGKHREMTLKFRQRRGKAVAQEADMEPAAAKGADCEDFKDDLKCKFEEEMKLEDGLLVTLYSVSTTDKKIGSDKKINNLADPGEFVPGFQRGLRSYDPKVTIQRVGGYTARELVIEGGRLVVSPKPNIKVDCGLVVWYNESGAQDKPDVAEFSFKYKEQLDHEEFAKQCGDVLKFISAEMKDWVDEESLTKTRFCYCKQCDSHHLCP
jgi:hypothetical protein